MQHGFLSSFRAGAALALIISAGTILTAHVCACGDPADAQAQVVEVREFEPGQGQAALDRFLQEHQDELALLQAWIERGEPIHPTDAQRALLDELDRLANQRDALWSRLYWHTDLDAALAESKATGKPIVSLRLLGRLDESLSCANSRFFRAALYPNAEVSAYLRDHFVLHWHTVRDAPVMTVDFGNGRVLKQTITGNSVHYILNSNGEVVDALPGVYAPSAFLASLKQAELTARTGSPAVAQAPQFSMIAAAQAQNELPRLADLAGALTTSKIAIERVPISSLLAATDTNAGPVPVVALPAHLMGATILDARSRSLIESQLEGDQLDATTPEMIALRFAASVQADTAMNTAVLRPQILALLQDPALRASPTDLDTRVYDEVFLSPVSDRWAGLVDPTAFSGLWTRDRMPGG